MRILGYFTQVFPHTHTHTKKQQKKTKKKKKKKKKTYVVVIRSREALLTRTGNIYFYREIRKHIPELFPNTPL